MIEYDEEWLLSLLLRIKGTSLMRASAFAAPAMLWAILLSTLEDTYPGFRQSLGACNIDKGYLWSASTGALTGLLVFRTTRAMDRFWEETGLLHQMRGEWFDLATCCVSFSRRARASQPMAVRNFRHTLVRLMSLCHASALEEIAGEGAKSVETIDSLGLDDKTLECLERDDQTFNTVEVITHMLRNLITEAHADEVMPISPPILSRVYQSLSKGFVHYLNALKIIDTHFPYPYAHLITVLLFGHVFLTPLMLTMALNNTFWAALFTYVILVSFTALNVIAIELENPFGTDQNNLPMRRFQADMNTSLMILLEDSADLIAKCDETRCTFDFQQLQNVLNAASGTCKVARWSGHISAQRNYLTLAECSWSTDSLRAGVRRRSVDHVNKITIAPLQHASV